MIKLHKNGGVKFLDSESSLVDLLKKEGWIEESNLSGKEDVELPKPRGPGRPKKSDYDVIVDRLEE